MIAFDLIYSENTSDFSSFLLAAKQKGIASIGCLAVSDMPFAGELSISATGLKEPVFCFFRFPYENRIWDLTKADELSALLSIMQRAGEDFLFSYRALCKTALDKTEYRFAFGLEAFGGFLGELRSSSVYRKTVLDLTDRLLKKGLSLGYAQRHPILDLSPCVLRRFAELRGDLLPASFATAPRDLGKGVENTLLSMRATGIGSYMTYENEGWERRPIATYKETS